MPNFFNFSLLILILILTGGFEQKNPIVFFMAIFGYLYAQN